MPKNYKRKARNFFINQNFQGKIILAVFLAVIVSCIFFVVIFGFFSADTMTISYKNNDLQMGQTPLMLFKDAIAANWIFLLTCGTLMVLVAIVGSHRIAGPLYRFEKSLESMKSRDLSDTIYLRENDEGKTLARQINDFNVILSLDIKEATRHTKAIQDLLNQYGALDRSKLSQDDIDSICSAIKSSNEKLKRIIGSYRLVDE